MSIQKSYQTIRRIQNEHKNWTKLRKWQKSPDDYSLQKFPSHYSYKLSQMLTTAKHKI